MNSTGSKIKVLVTGGKGQLGKCIAYAFLDNEKIDAFFPDIEDLDITDKKKVEEYISDLQPDIIVNCAAYTAVDKAEDEEDIARLINVTGIENLAYTARTNGIKLIHISTDYVFDGTKTAPYLETDSPNPLSVYGTTKFSGERRLQELCQDAIIIRTAWLYSQYGKNFFLTMKNRAEQKLESMVVNDQTGTPTNASDLAKAILKIIVADRWMPGIYHFTNQGKTTWFDFARAIYGKYGADKELVTPISTQQYGAKARRPFNSLLNTDKIAACYDLKIPGWEEGLERAVSDSIDTQN